MYQILESLEGVTCQTDEILVYGRTEREHDEPLKQVLSRLQNANLTLNAEKSEFKKDLYQICLGPEGVSADPVKVASIRDLAALRDVHRVRRFLGMVNQLGKFTPMLAEYSKPIRDLPSSKNQFCWGSNQQAAFEKIKTLLTSTPVLALYDPNKYTVLKTDASNFGVGATLFQKQDNGDLKPVTYASRALSQTEQRYSTLEKEALGVSFGCERNRDYLIGKHFHIETDHKPLVSLLGKKDLHDLPIRIQRFRLKLMQFSYSISHVPGKQLIIQDLLCRQPVNHELTCEEKQLSLDTKTYVDSVFRHLPTTDMRLQEIKEKQRAEGVKLEKYIGLIREKFQ